MLRICLINPISGQGHLDAYARLYSRALVELGHEVILIGVTDGGTHSYLSRSCPFLKDAFKFISFDELEVRRREQLDASGNAQALGATNALGSGPAPLNLSRAQIMLRVWRTAYSVWRDDGASTFLRLTGRRSLRSLARITPLWAKRRFQSFLRTNAFSLRRLKGPARAIAKLKADLRVAIAPDAGQIKFDPLIRYAADTAQLASGGRLDLQFYLYLDMMTRYPPSLSGLQAAEAQPWVGILFHPQAADGDLSNVEAYFKTNSARGGVFLVPRALPPYASALPDLTYTVAPDVADLELAERPHPLVALMKDKAGGRTIVLLIGTIAPHKGIMTLLEVIERADPSRFFFTIVGRVHWESFGQEAPALRSFYESPPENVLVHADYIAEERDYNTLVAACDIIFSVYRDFDSSSNSLTKAAGFERRILVSEGSLMGTRVEQARLGATTVSRDPNAVLNGLRELAEKRLDEFDFRSYTQAHSLDALKVVLAEALPRWCDTKVSDET